MEDIINRLKKFKAADDSAKEMENTIKEAVAMLEKQQEQLQEKDKIIDLIAKYLVKNSDLDTDICSKRTTDCYADMYEDNACEKCIIEYFTKKAREV